ncbi:hypothetical protein GCM10009801_65230 [Streptomyces albiaxialis]|uniref:Oxalate:formate antiporter n=1 Tax=Streptomyces albiaxialis TaxID=329523 RepID=A0ABN2WNT8_9ACTN
MSPTDSARPETGTPRRIPLTVLAWLWVGAPLAYGLYELISKAAKLFTG